jgi:hypothetical protein
MHDPREPHLTAVKRILRYLHNIVDLELFVARASSPHTLTVYTDADWAETLIAPRQGTSCSSVTVSSPGLASDN